MHQFGWLWDKGDEFLKFASERRGYPEPQKKKKTGAGGGEGGGGGGSNPGGNWKDLLDLAPNLSNYAEFF